MSVQFPGVGRPLRTTLPVNNVQVGGVIVPTVGGSGEGGWAGITALPEDGDVQPASLVTVKVYVPELSPEMVVVVPVPVFIIPPGVPLTVQVPDDGSPFRTTLPFDRMQVGPVMVPMVGAEG